MPHNPRNRYASDEELTPVDAFASLSERFAIRFARLSRQDQARAMQLVLDWCDGQAEARAAMLHVAHVLKDKP
jgi:hypothetical protein